MGGGYARESSGYRVVAAEALSLHCGGVAVFYCKAGRFTLELLCLHGPNVASFQVVTVQLRWHVAEDYITPNDASTIEYIVVAISRRP